MGGQIIDATLVAAPKQKLSVDEKAVIKTGGMPPGWSKAKRRQKDRDARWTLKRGRAKPKPESGAARTGVEIAVPVFGYKSHLNIDRRHGLIRGWTVTDAAAHDSRSLPDLLDAENTASGCGRTRRIGPGGTWRRCSGADCASASSSAGRRGDVSPGRGPVRTPHGRGCVPPSSTYLPGRSTGWRCSSAPSAWRERG